MKNLEKFLAGLETKIQNSYVDGVSIDEAEKLAAEFLGAQMVVSAQLSKADLDARMRKTGVKTLRATLYNTIVSKSDKKPTEAMIESQLNTEEIIVKEQDGLDEAEVTRDELKRYYDIFLNAHIYFRGVAKGKFE